MKIKINQKDIKKQRITWGFNPIERVVPSKKRYNRQKAKRINFQDY